MSSDSKTKEMVLKKLELLAGYQAKVAILNKESDKLHEFKGKEEDQEEIAKLKNFINKR